MAQDWQYVNLAVFLKIFARKKPLILPAFMNLKVVEHMIFDVMVASGINLFL